MRKKVNSFFRPHVLSYYGLGYENYLGNPYLLTYQANWIKTGSVVAMDDFRKRHFSLMLNMTLGSCCILSIGIIASLVVFCACT